MDNKKEQKVTEAVYLVALGVIVLYYKALILAGAVYNIFFKKNRK